MSSTFKIHGVFHVSSLQQYTTYGRVQPTPPPAFEKDASCEVEHVLSYEDRGSHSRPSGNSIYINGSDVHLSLILGSQRAT